MRPLEVDSPFATFASFPLPTASPHSSQHILLSAYQISIVFTLVCLCLLLRWNLQERVGAIRLSQASLPLEEESENTNESQRGTERREALLGKPIDEAEYQRLVRRNRTLLAAVSFLGLGVDLVDLLVSQTELGQWPVKEDTFFTGCDVFLWFVVLIATLSPLSQKHFVTRVVIAFILITTSLTLKLTRVATQIQSEEDEALLVQGLSLCFTISAWLLSGCTPLGPKRLYRRLSVEETDGVRQVYPADDGGAASIFSRIFFSHATPIAAAALSKGVLHTDDLYGPGLSWRAETVSHELADVYERESRELRTRQVDALANGKPPPRSPWPLVRAIIKTNSGRIIWGNTLGICCAILRFGPVLCINHFLAALEAVEDETSGLSQRLRTVAPWGVGVFIAAVVYATLNEHFSYWMNTCLYIPFQGQLSTLLIAKALRRKDTTAVTNPPTLTKSQGGGADDLNKEEEESGESTEGFSTSSQVLTLLSTDVERIASVGWSTTSVAVEPVQLVVGLYYLYTLLGISAIWGILASVPAGPITYYLGKYDAVLADRIQNARDKRVTVISEVLQSIKMIKLNAWEERARAKVDKVRQEELRSLFPSIVLGMVMYIVVLLSPVFMGTVALGHYALVRGEPLTASIAFPAITVLTDLQWALSALPNGIVDVLQAAVSLRRLALYLQGEEVTQTTPPMPASASSTSEASPVALIKATVTWPVDNIGVVAKNSETDDLNRNQAFQLTDVDVVFASGQLNLIVGRLGAGKTLLLRALIGEADTLSGRVQSPRSSPSAILEDGNTISQPYDTSKWLHPSRVAYVPQSTYLQSGSIRENILYGLPLWEERFQATLDACGLQPDLATFEDGDLTCIGENGVTLSGGQKARVSLARAVYSRASTLLLDDCLSAVDAEIGAHIHSKLLQGPLCQGRTVILVSHQLQLVAPIAAKVIVLDQGRVAFDGSSQAYLASKWSKGLAENDNGIEGDGKKRRKAAGSALSGRSSTSSLTALGESSTTSATLTPKGTPPNEAEALKTVRKTIKEETRAVGTIPLSIYLEWLLAGNTVGYWLLVGFICLLSPAVFVCSKLWFAWWMQDAAMKDHLHSTLWWLTWYTVLQLASLTIVAVRSVSIYSNTIASSRALFRRMTNAVLRAPMSFHDSCPMGRLLVRFTSDFQMLDGLVPTFAMSFVACVLNVFFNTVGVFIGGGAVALLPILLILPCYVWYGRLYCIGTRDARRLSRLAYSQVTSAVTEILNATPVIRAFGASEYLNQRYFDLYDNWLIAKVPTAAFNNYIGLRLELVGAVMMFLVASLIIFDPGAAYGRHITAATAGFLLTTIKNIENVIESALHAIAILEQSVVSVERIVEYTKLPSEAAEIVEPRPPSEWPSQGKIEFRDVAVRYSTDLPLVLKAINFSIPPCAKVAIVGATGSGKSTLVSSLFRLLEVESGQILIDDLDISKIGLRDLRSRLQIVPQDPIILAGSLRSAVDILGKFSDEEILSALKAVALIREPTCDDDGHEHLPCMTTPGTSTNFSDLDYLISERGGNLSAGERQLICLARCILSQSKIIVLDEATSSTDTETDAIVSSTIHRDFSQSTVLAIAHRLRSIINFDMVIVIDHGQVAEIGSPDLLLEKGETSQFFRLCRATGEAEFAYLKEKAAQKEFHSLV